MSAEITMPQLSDTMSEGTLVKWNKKEGDKIKAGEEIADIETDKATMPMEAFESGTLALIRVQEGRRSKSASCWRSSATGREALKRLQKEIRLERQSQPAATPPAAQSPPKTPSAATRRLKSRRPPYRQLPP